MPITFISTPTRLRTNLRRLARGAERIDLYAAAVSDPLVVDLLVAAAGRGAEVHVTTNLDTKTPPDVIDRLVDAGADVATFDPTTTAARRRKGHRFEPGLLLFDNETDWWTGAIVGRFNATDETFAADLETVTLVETAGFEDGAGFDEGDEAGDYLLKVLDWSDTVKRQPLDDKRRRRHLKEFIDAGAPGSRAPGTKASIVEVKPSVTGYASPLSWREILRCEWGTYWNALLEADRLRGTRAKDSLCGPRGWLAAIDASNRAFAGAPETWADPKVRDELLGRTKETSLLGRIGAGTFSDLLAKDEEFRRDLHATVEQCVRETSSAVAHVAITTFIGKWNVPLTALSRVLAAAAPDRFFSVQGETMQDRVSNVVGFDLAAESAFQSHVSRYIDAVEMIRQSPWALAETAERASEHVREPDAWANRVALLGCLIC
jgi:hypothetical protein